jgi:hypothetical protein
VREDRLSFIGCEEYGVCKLIDSVCSLPDVAVKPIYVDYTHTIDSLTRKLKSKRPRENESITSQREDRMNRQQPNLERFQLASGSKYHSLSLQVGLES